LRIPFRRCPTFPPGLSVSGTLFDYANQFEQLNALDKELSRPDFWDDQEAARETVGRLKKTKALVEPIRDLLSRQEEAQTMVEMLSEEEDASTRAELENAVRDLSIRVPRVELLTLLSRPNDGRDCYFNIQAGTGGADACDWAEMLLRLYTRYFEQMEYDVELLARKDGEEAGIQSVNLYVKGSYAYGYLSCEVGVHRLVRVSPFSGQGKRETSFASVDVQPDVDDIEIEVDWDKDVREDTYRSSGAGGQHVNKTSSAVRLTHLPTSVVAQCQNERSQHKNRAAARKMLMARLYQVEEAKRDEELAKYYGSKGQISWGNAIRSYFLYPEQRVKDSRTGQLTSNTQGVLDGEIQEFIDAELRRRALARKK
jgi:peptide chain release factor 2